VKENEPFPEKYQVKSWYQRSIKERRKQRNARKDCKRKPKN
jgi:hypothetical protein